MRSEGSKLLAAIGMTQREKASRIGVNQGTIARWESGDALPSERNQRALESAFAIPLSSWPNDWTTVRDTIIRVLSSRAPHLLNEIADELEKVGVTHI